MKKQTKKLSVDTAVDINTDIQLSAQEQQTRKRSGMQSFFKRTWKAVKRPFQNKTKEEPIIPPLLPDARPSHSDVTSVPCTSEQVGFDSSHARTPDGDDELEVLSINNKLSVSTHASAEVTENNTVESNKQGHKKAKKTKGVRGFFKRTWKAVKRPFRRKTREEPIHSPDSDVTSVPCTSGQNSSDPSPVKIPNGDDELEVLSINSEPSVSETTESITVENNTQEHHVEAEKKTRKCGFFKRTGKSPFRCKAQVEPDVPDSSDYEPTPGYVDNYYENKTFQYLRSFGWVMVATRRSDNQKVILKYLSKYKQDEYLSVPGTNKLLLTEVAMLLQMRQDPASPHVVQVLDWFDRPHYTALALEYGSTTWGDMVHISCHMGEKASRILMRQAVQAVQSSIKHGVFMNNLHRDTFIINERSLDLKLCNFSCCLKFTTAGYQPREYRGKLSLISPEALTGSKFHAVPTNVWQLGVLLYEMLYGLLPNQPLKKCPDLPEAFEESHSLIKMCLDVDPEKRPTLEEILQHPWLAPE